MARKTDGVSVLVQSVLSTIPSPYEEDITEDIFVRIEHTPHWREQYEILVRSLSKKTVNQMIGRYTEIQTGMEAIKQVGATRTKLAGSYSKLRPITSR